ncbi:hypothetical protein VTL71DRAFT_9703 [Oculimacula yallundae]|uniref:Heterokaryon incompatibility domain-containing protein n=1 Tax=Oculimacula yallundae TaxID=86028 RepID=A0ABR4BUF5_9HELO
MMDGEIRTSRSLFESQHSCNHCQIIIIDPSATHLHAPGQRYAEIINNFEISAAEITRAVQDKCLLFEGLTSTKDKSEAVAAQLHIHETKLAYEQSPSRIVVVDFILKGALTHDTLPPDIIAVSVFGRWADEEILPGKGMHFLHPGYHVHTEAGNLAASYVSTRPFYPYIFQETMFQRIKGWIKECETHEECIQTPGKSLEPGRGSGPARLLYVGSSANSTVSLVDRRPNMEYIALSYCWGGDDSMKLTKLEFQSWTQSIPFTDLPKTIQDGIICTRRLGLKYLWVDRLCIIQDNAADITQEITAMPEVYKLAYLTLSASSAVSSQDGFLQSREEANYQLSRSRIALPYKCPDGSIGSIALVTHREYSHAMMPNTTPVDARAWTMQEQRLSSRLLQFCSYHLLWRCNSMERVHEHSETSSSNVDRPMTDHDRSFPIDPVPEDENWESILKDYTGRALSYSGDKLVAISAVAQDTPRRLNSHETSEIEAPRCLAGLWEHHLPYALCWRRLCDDEDLSPRPTSYRAPSWSWAAVDGFIYEYPSKIQDGQSIQIVILECVVTPMAKIAPFSAVLSGYLRVRGRVREELWDRMRKGFVGEGGETILSLTSWPDAVEDESSRRVKVWCLEVGFNGRESEDHDAKQGPFGLLLMKAGNLGESEDVETVFKRMVIGNGHCLLTGKYQYHNLTYDGYHYGGYLSATDYMDAENGGSVSSFDNSLRIVTKL